MTNVWSELLDDEDIYIAEHESVFFRKFLEIAKISERILEIGAGKGRMVKILRFYSVGSEIVCLDINKFVSNCQNICHPIIGDARYLPFKDNTFDLVYSLGVIEHFPETETSISEHIRVLKRGGHLLITTPHLSIYTPLRWMFWLMKYRNLGSFEEVIGRNLTLKYFKKELEKYANVEVIDCGVAGVFSPKPYFRKFFNVLPENIFGAYLWILCKKI